MTLMSIADWVDEYLAAEYAWFVKRLSGNDTMDNKSHQAGPYIPKAVIFALFPSLAQSLELNPRRTFTLIIDSHPDIRQNVSAIWYNNKYRGGTYQGTRDETRLTNFGGKSSVLLDPESTGSLCIFAFRIGSEGEAVDCHVWVCDNAVEEDFVENRIGPVEPGKHLFLKPDSLASLSDSSSVKKSCWLKPDQIPSMWLKEFPSGLEIIRRAIEMRPVAGRDVDERLIQRRDCEYEIYRSVEQAIELPRIQQGFQDIDTFFKFAQTILQRRKARSGRSLELHTRELLLEEGFIDGSEFAYQPESEPGKTPDFLFPSQAAYNDPDFPTDRLRMLAVKTTCKDRWRQILNEANRVQKKHLLTLQQGVSEKQFCEMAEAQVQLVVPKPLIEKYPSAVQPHLLTLDDFMVEIRHLQLI
jgi:hypothetical protein